MLNRANQNDATVVDRLAEANHPVARAAQLLEEGKYNRAVDLCREHLPDFDHSLAARLIYARALFHAGQTDTAASQFYRVLARDPENVVALKYLGDIRHIERDSVGANANYRRVLDIDPRCRGVASSLTGRTRTVTRTITLRSGGEEATGSATSRIPFVTETIGDLYLAQGHTRLAAEVFRRLTEQSDNPRYAEKLARVQKSAKQREE